MYLWTMPHRNIVSDWYKTKHLGDLSEARQCNGAFFHENDLRCVLILVSSGFVDFEVRNPIGLTYGTHLLEIQYLIGLKHHFQQIRVGRDSETITVFSKEVDLILQKPFFGTVSAGFVDLEGRNPIGLTQGTHLVEIQYLIGLKHHFQPIRVGRDSETATILLKEVAQSGVIPTSDRPVWVVYLSISCRGSEVTPCTHRVSVERF